MGERGGEGGGLLTSPETAKAQTAECRLRGRVGAASGVGVCARAGQGRDCRMQIAGSRWRRVWALGWASGVREEWRPLHN